MSIANSNVYAVIKTCVIETHSGTELFISEFYQTFK